MPINHEKLITIISDQCQKIPQRCEGYRQELINTIADILLKEREHSVSALNIQKVINNKCSATGTYLFSCKKKSGDLT